jgi:hypothetical protein
MTISLQCSKKNIYRSDLKFFRFFFFFFEIIIVSTKLPLDVWETGNKVTRSWMGQHLEKELTSLFETV